ncbi:MAG: transcription antitermination factor NusB [Thermoleophilia bacterium]|nr:transcription antitermination factor NusB [Thermoleophilia bacterium]
MTPAISRREARRQAVILLYQRDVTGLPVPELAANALRSGEFAGDPWTDDVVSAVDTGRDDIDRRISAAATGWTTDRIAPLERNILRVATLEIVRAEVPVAVAIDEAVEMAKKWCGAETPAFVNGVLGRVARDAGEAAA